MAGVNEIRSAFIDFFIREGHTAVPSSPLVPRNDPTLMFANSGMVQFKNLFLGQERRPYTQAVTAQKCVRAGGKHNDLDNVGYTARHHTFFEMMGNFSFGDYFKERAIDLAWRLVTQVYGLPKERLLVTVFAEDEEAHSLWQRIAGLGEDRIIRIATADNFWRMGDTGPCGPCSEIFFDHGPAIAGGPPGSADADGDRFIEIWNLVFMQYEEMAGGERVPLPRPSIDTGMGLERVAAVLQGVHDNYDIDLFSKIIGLAAAVTGADPAGPHRASLRVMADHVRCGVFLIADGVLPGNEGRGYVLRRIMRRAMRHAALLGVKDPVLWRVVPAVLAEMGAAYPEIMRAEALIAETFRLEELRFRRTLERGLALLEEEVRDLGPGGALPGETAFRLYDTYGFPLDLTEDALRARGLKVDHGGFVAAMARQRAEARRNWAGSGESATDPVWLDLRERHGATEFLGYHVEAADGLVLAVIVEGAEVAAAEAGASVALLVNQTPFYGESGGQKGDSGVIAGEGFRVRVDDAVKAAGDLIVHRGVVVEGRLAPGQPARLTVDGGRRAALRRHHSATHLLHEALRMTLGDHVAQKGSLVAEGRLRFDFSQPRPLTEAERQRVEDIANAVVLQDAPVETRLMGVDDAMASGARALFGEKYGDEVRVVSMGVWAEDGAQRPFSVELCGGTHVARTGEIGPILVVAEGAVSAGVRRIEALAGEAARQHVRAALQREQRVAELLRVPVDEAPARLEAVLEEKRALEREVTQLKRKAALAGEGAVAAAPVREIAGVPFVARVVEGLPPQELRGLVDEEKRRLGRGIVVLVGLDGDGKAGVAVGVTADLTARFDAVALVRAASEPLGGRGGGGRRDMAQAGGPNGAAAAAALAAVEAAIIAG